MFSLDLTTVFLIVSVVLMLMFVLMMTPIVIAVVRYVRKRKAMYSAYRHRHIELTRQLQLEARR